MDSTTAGEKFFGSDKWMTVGLSAEQPALCELAGMRNGHKLKQLLYVCDISLSLRDDETLVLTAVHKGTYETHTKEGKTFSAVLDKAYRQMLRVAGE